MKRGLLALSRLLGCLQRREAPALRDSRLTRLLQGALDQVRMQLHPPDLWRRISVRPCCETAA